ncbi:hypothetical protein DQG23_31130 [Paenibacillus contaminans]|uniref:HAD family hydrolase n=1 Tax=Paenibacillus contaminans TaxID=450362 RepID=A0A329M3X7_9BACL|nr:hypothetical protein DQG23_31130 [Paenibacillus contaminans]
MYPIKLVLFDLDDTLLHFDDYWENSVKDAFRNHFFTSEMNSNEYLIRAIPLTGTRAQYIYDGSRPERSAAVSQLTGSII